MFKKCKFKVCLKKEHHWGEIYNKDCLYCIVPIEQSEVQKALILSGPKAYLICDACNKKTNNHNKLQRDDAIELFEIHKTHKESRIKEAIKYEVKDSI